VASLAEFAFNSNTATVSDCHMFDNGQTQAGASEFAASALVHTGKPFAEGANGLMLTGGLCTAVTEFA